MRLALTIAIVLAWSTATSAQDAVGGRIARSSVGQAGQRETREQSALPTGPIDSRIQNRVQSRIRNRIDRFYDPQANAAAPFRIADEQARVGGRTRR